MAMESRNANSQRDFKKTGRIGFNGAKCSVFEEPQWHW